MISDSGSLPDPQSTKQFREFSIDFFLRVVLRSTVRQHDARWIQTLQSIQAVRVTPEQLPIWEEAHVWFNYGMYRYICKGEDKSAW